MIVYKNILEHLNIYLFKSKFGRWTIFTILSTFLLVYCNSNKHMFCLDSDKRNKKTKENLMIDKITNLFNDLENYSEQYNITILMKDEKICKNKIEQMMKDGPNFLQIISDFDRTMSSYWHKSKPNLTSHGVLESNPELSEELKNQCEILRNKYYPIEVDTRLTNAEKIPFMMEWWSKVHDLLVGARLHKNILKTTVKQAPLSLRSGCVELMQTLHDHKIPVLVFSAGIGNVIQEILACKHILLDNVRIVSNFMNFNSEGILVGFQDEVIHSFNKSAKSIQDSQFFENICTKRINVILLGDSTGDQHMADGLSEDANVLKIGFLNTNVERLSEKYMEIYDLVFVTDETFIGPSLIVNAIINC